MDKKTLLAVGISMAILLVWQFWFTPQLLTQQEKEVSPRIEESTATKVEPSQTEVLVAENQPSGSFTLNEPIKIKTDVIELAFDPETGDIRYGAMSGWKDVEGADITFNKGGGFNYLRLISPIAKGYSYSLTELANGKKVSFTSKSGDLVVTKNYTLNNGSYVVKSSISVVNAGNATLNIPLMVKIGGGLGDGFEDSQYIFEGAMIASQNSVEKVAIEKTSTEELANPLWVGYTSKYFLMAAAGGAFTKATITPSNNEPIASMEKSIIVNPGDRASNDFDIYLGPKEYPQLKALGLGLDKSIDFGWFYFLAIPMLQVMIFLYGFLGNYGVAIIVLTIIIKVITLPLTLKSMKSMKAMSAMQPEIVALKEKFKGDPQKLNVATMEIYKKHNINPVSGCLPMVIQIPIFFALYKALLLSIELKDAPFFGWLVDLSAKDPYYITPIIMGATMFIQQKMTPSTADPMQQKIFLAMPIVFTFLFLNFPSGLVIYWLTNNVLSIAQQYIVNKRTK